MTGVTNTHEEILNAHVDGGETMKAVHSDGEETLAVTGTRLLHIVTGEDTERQAYETDMISLDSVASVKTDFLEEEPTDILSLAAGTLLSAVTAFLFLASTDQTGTSSTLLLLGSLGVALGALVAFANAYDTDDSKVTIEVQPAAGDVRTYKMPKGGVDLATAVTEQAA